MSHRHSHRRHLYVITRTRRSTRRLGRRRLSLRRAHHHSFATQTDAERARAARPERARRRFLPSPRGLDE